MRSTATPRLCLACSCKSRAGLASTALAAAESAIICEDEVLHFETSSLTMAATSIAWRLQFMTNTSCRFSHSNRDTPAKQLMRDMITIAREKTTRKTHRHRYSNLHAQTPHSYRELKTLDMNQRFNIFTLSPEAVFFTS